MEERSAPDEIDDGRGSPRVLGRRGPERLEAFSDGVFAIAITLLVLEIRVPPAQDLASPDRLIPALAALWPSYLGYGVSFVTIGIMWANHHNLIRLVATVSHGLILANLLLLLAVGFVPFPTALLAATLGTPSGQIGVLVYAATFVGITRSYRLGPPGFLVAFVAALVNPALGMTVILVLVALYLCPRRREREGLRRLIPDSGPR